MNNDLILEIINQEEFNHYNSSHIFFNRIEFNLLNKKKCDQLLFIIAKSRRKAKIGLIAGITKGVLQTPFSAPFGGPFLLGKSVSLENIYEFPKLLIELSKKLKLKRIELYFPPSFYSQEFYIYSINAFVHSNYHINYIDINHHFELHNFNDKYHELISHSARKNLNQSLNNKLYFDKCRSPDEQEIAYNILKKNREEKGYKLNLSYDEIKRTINLVEHDFFLVKHDPGTPIAASIAFHVTTEIIQIIYWGNLLESNSLRPMNFLSFKLFEYYKKSNKKVVDIGTSSINGMPNYGLCKFKSAIGCQSSHKFKFILDL